jgi:hypothetical protein
MSIGAGGRYLHQRKWTFPPQIQSKYRLQTIVEGGGKKKL